MDVRKILELTPKNPYAFKILIDTIGGVLEECDIIIKKDEVYINTMDQSKTVGINFKSSKKNYKKLYVDPKLDKFILGLNLKYLSVALKSVNNSPDYRLTLSIDSDKQNLLRIRQKNKINRIKLIQVLSSTNVDIKLNIQVKAQMNTKYFYDTCREVSHISGKLEVRFLEDKIKFIGRGDSGDISILCSTDDKESGSELIIKKEVDDDLNITAFFELKQIMAYSRLQNISDKLVIFITNNHILGIKYMIDDLGDLYLFFSPIDDSNNYEYNQDHDLYEEHKIDDIM